MKRLRHVLSTGVKHFAFSAPLGAYHLYLLDVEHSKQREQLMEEVRAMLMNTCLCITHSYVIQTIDAS